MTDLDPILDVNGEVIDAIWAAEFRGFFWGEGSLGVYLHQPHKIAHPDRLYVGYSYSVIASITARTDELDALRAIQSRLGGTLHVRKGFYVAEKDGSHRTTSFWRVSHALECDRLGRLLAVNPTRMPFRKRLQLAAWQEANTIRSSKKRGRGTPYTDAEAERMRWLSDELKRLKDWVG